MLRIQLFKALRAAAPRKRLWLFAAGVTLFAATITIANCFVRPTQAFTGRSLGHDFLAFYTGGAFAREGRSHALYDLDAIRSFQHTLDLRIGLHLGDGFGPFWNPPFYAWVFAPLSALSFSAALATWLAVGLIALVVALAVLCRMLNAADWRSWALVPVLVLISAPFLTTFTHSQNTFTSLLLLALIVAVWRSRRGFAAGLVAGLLLYKPQLVAVLALILILDLGIPAAAGIALTAALLLAITSISMPGALTNYLHNLPINIRFMQVDNPYAWERHVTFKAFWRLMLQGHTPGEATTMVRALTLLCSVTLGSALLAGALRLRRIGSALGRDRLISATIIAMPLLMPFYFDYDLLLLAVPAVLFASDLAVRRNSGSFTGADRLLTAAWIALFLWLMVNPDVADLTHFNGTVALLAATATLAIARCFQAAATAAQSEISSPLVRLAA